MPAKGQDTVQEEPVEADQSVEEPVEGPVTEEEHVLTKDELMDMIAEGPLTEVINGFKVRGLTDEEHQKLWALRAEMGSKAPEGRKEEAFFQAEAIGLLEFGVIEPKLSRQEWVQLSKSAPTNLLEPVREAIKRISGLDREEVEIAKKVLEEMRIG